MKQFYLELLCKIKHHLWIEWEHGGDRDRREFYPRRATLINPECARCGIRKYKNEREALKFNTNNDI